MQHSKAPLRLLRATADAGPQPLSHVTLEVTILDAFDDAEGHADAWAHQPRVVAAQTKKFPHARASIWPPTRSLHLLRILKQSLPARPSA